MVKTQLRHHAEEYMTIHGYTSLFVNYPETPRNWVLAHLLASDRSLELKNHWVEIIQQSFKDQD